MNLGMGMLLISFAQTAATPAPAPAVAPSPVLPDKVPYKMNRSYFIGTWTDNRDCSKGTTRFNADGTFVAPSGGSGKWELDGNQLTLSGASVVHVTAVAIDQTAVEIFMANGSHGVSSRCS